MKDFMKVNYEGRIAVGRGQGAGIRGKLKTEGGIFMDHVLNDVGAAAFLGLAVQSLRNIRSHREGPAYIKLGRRVVYKVSDLEEYLNRHRIDPQARKR